MHSSNQPKHVSCCRPWQWVGSRAQEVQGAVPSSRTTGTSRTTEWTAPPVTHQAPAPVTTPPRTKTIFLPLHWSIWWWKAQDTQEWDALNHRGCSHYFGPPVSPAASQEQVFPVHQRPVAGCTAFPRRPTPVTAVPWGCFEAGWQPASPNSEKTQKQRWLQASHFLN